MDLSEEPLPIHWPSGEKATDFTPSEWPSNVANKRPVEISNNFIVLSSEKLQIF